VRNGEACVSGPPEKIEALLKDDAEVRDLELAAASAPCGQRAGARRCRYRVEAAAPRPRSDSTVREAMGE
jgi:hypothetical protein